MSITSARELITKLGQLLKVRATNLCGIDEMSLRYGFKRRELSPLTERKIQLIRIPDLEDNDLMIRVPKMSQRLHQLFGIVKQIRNNDQQTATMNLHHHFVKHIA